TCLRSRLSGLTSDPSSPLLLLTRAVVMAATKLETSSAMVDVLTRAVTDAADLVSGLSGQVTQLRGEVTQLRGIVMHKRGIVITLEQRSDAPDMSADEKADLEAELRVANNELRVGQG
ncbi:uncharacterized protein AMSG_11538, partial [Thecamonas trahens ATCC 50062]